MRMHPSGQILNQDNKKEYQGREKQHFHAPIHAENEPIIDEDDDEVVAEFGDKYILCSLGNNLESQGSIRKSKKGHFQL